MVGKDSGAVAGGGGLLPGGWVFLSSEGVWQLGLGFGVNESYLYPSTFNLGRSSRLI